MNTLRLLALAPVLFTGACALETAKNRVADGTIVMTQVGPDQVAACIAESAGAAAAPTTGGAYAVDVPDPQGPVRLTITRDKVQTIVAGSNETSVPTRIAKMAVDCVLKLTPPAKQ